MRYSNILFCTFYSNDSASYVLFKVPLFIFLFKVLYFIWERIILLVTSSNYYAGLHFVQNISFRLGQYNLTPAPIIIQWASKVLLKKWIL